MIRISNVQKSSDPESAVSETIPREPVSSNARLWFGLTALVVFFGLVLQVVLVARDDSGFFATPLSRSFNLLFFFTILSNIMVAVSCLLLFMNPNRCPRGFRLLRLCGVVGIAVTGVVYHGVLAQLIDLHGWDWLADFILHTVSPIMAVLGWFIFGPRGLTTRKVVGLTVIFPAVYGAMTLIRGPIVDWYPYPFMDPREKGYGHVALNCVIVAVLFVSLSAGAHGIDEWLSSRRGARST